MSGLIEEIQRGAMGSNVPLTTLLRQTKVAARKLKLEDLESWIGHELDGYSERDNLPDYRILHGRAVALNPYQGWIPIIMPNSELNEMLSTIPIMQSVASLETINLKSPDISVPLSPEQVRLINQMMNVQFGRMVVQLSGGQIYNILESTRSRVLDWALDMEAAGVTGNGMSFDQREVTQAQGVIFNIQNSGTLAGPIGLGNSTGNIKISTIDAVALSNILSQLTDSISALARDGVDQDDLESKIEDLHSEIKKVEPNQGRLRKCAEALKDTLTGAAGNLVAHGAIQQISALLAI